MEAFIKVFLLMITIFYAISLHSTYSLRACLHGGWVPRLTKLPGEG